MINVPELSIDWFFQSTQKTEAEYPAKYLLSRLSVAWYKKATLNALEMFITDKIEKEIERYMKGNNFQYQDQNFRYEAHIFSHEAFSALQQITTDVSSTKSGNVWKKLFTIITCTQTNTDFDRERVKQLIHTGSLRTLERHCFVPINNVLVDSSIA